MRTELIVSEKWAFTFAEKIDFKVDGTNVDGPWATVVCTQGGVGRDMEGRGLGRGVRSLSLGKRE